MANRKKFIKETLDQYVMENRSKEHQYLIEGIDIDEVNRVVSFNPDHEDNVDTSVILNPTYSEIGDVKVISIFKRKTSKKSSFDGNPLIYALKDIKGWKFNNPKSDIINLLRQFVRISEKIQDHYDVIITIPSQNELNTKFLYRLNKIIKSEVEIEDYFWKLTAEDVYENYIDWGLLSKDFGPDYERVKKVINGFFFDMNNDNDGYFSYKFIKDPKLRKYIKKTMRSDEKKLIEYSDFINGKDILILDDTISSGSTISEICKMILETFVPKSVTVVTLFSKL
jgi:hypothetical protein